LRQLASSFFPYTTLFRSAYLVAETIQAMIKAGGLQNLTSEQRADLESVVQNSFQFLLAILLNIHSSGVQRLDETCSKGLTALERSEEHTSELQSRGHLVC